MTTLSRTARCELVSDPLGPMQKGARADFLLIDGDPIDGLLLMMTKEKIPLP